MNPGQKMFYDFIVKHATGDKIDEAKAILEECFKKQKEGTFNREYFNEVAPKLTGVVKPEAVDELKAAMKMFAAKL